MKGINALHPLGGILEELSESEIGYNVHPEEAAMLDTIINEIQQRQGIVHLRIQNDSL